MSFVNPETGWVIGVNDWWRNPSQSNGPNKLTVLRTLDGGKHWQRQFAREYPGGPVGGIGIDFVNVTTGWFLTGNMATMTGDLCYTADGGGNWQKINQLKCSRPSPTEVRFITPLVGWIPLDVGAGPIAGGLLLARDGGKTWTAEGE